MLVCKYKPDRQAEKQSRAAIHVYRFLLNLELAVGRGDQHRLWKQFTQTRVTLSPDRDTGVHPSPHIQFSLFSIKIQT